MVGGEKKNMFLIVLFVHPRSVGKLKKIRLKGHNGYFKIEYTFAEELQEYAIRNFLPVEVRTFCTLNVSRASMTAKKDTK